MSARGQVIDVVDLLARLVRIDSVNPTLDTRGGGEAAIAQLWVEELDGLGLDPQTHEVVDGRVNVVATLPGAEGAPTLLFESHMDTVPQPPEPIAVTLTDERLSGRGACDTKASGAAMVAAMAQLRSDGLPHATVIFAATVDEETRQRGSTALLDHLPSVEGAVIGEPTSLCPVRVHNGVLRFSIIAHGKPAHTSKAELGVNAIAAAGRAVAALDGELLPRLRERVHELAGPALLTPAMIHGGTADNVVPESCEIRLDRRLAPGESPEAALAEVDDLLDRLRQGGDEFTLKEPELALRGAETDASHPIVRVAEAVTGAPAAGAPYCTDAAQLSALGGLAFVVLGPGSIDQAHTTDEWVSLEQVRRAVDVYAAIARDAVGAWQAR